MNRSDIALLQAITDKVRIDPDTTQFTFCELAAQRTRRLDAAARLPPLRSGRRDPLRRRTDGRTA